MTKKSKKKAEYYCDLGDHPTRMKPVILAEGLAACKTCLKTGGTLPS